MLTPYLPYPLLSGGQIRTYNLLKNLAKKHEITLFSFIRADEENAYKKELLKFCRRVETFKRRPAWSLVNILLAGLTPFPFLVSIYYSRTLRHAIEEELNKNDYHLIHSETFYVMPNIPKTNVPILLVEQTIEFLVYQHFTKTVFLPLRLLLSLDVGKIKFWEKFYWKRAKKVVAMSEADKDVMEDEVPHLDVDIVPNGVDTEEFFKIRRASSSRPTILFVGNFKWLQNRESVSILVKEVFPQITAKLPDAKLWIVGRYPTEDIKQYESPQVKISANVNDIKLAYANSDLLLAPIYGPGGTRYKILEAMASGLPVVTTSRGIEGLIAKDGKDVLVKDDPQSLAQSTIELLTNQKLAERLSQNGKKLVATGYNWKSISQKLNDLYLEVGKK
ncbi:glycosyltransferase [Candidatus Gottesmanbacteria bacterium]|nr:glycosyltransferase [Candidatus Gottesmanbacteria bacterium]